MLKFDKIKLVSSAENINYIDSNSFEKRMKNGRISSWYYSQTEPYNLYIEKKNKDGELIIEFTGKILLEDYPLLINKDTIKCCLDNINKLNICHLDVDCIMNDAIIVKCDVTQDVKCDNLRHVSEGILHDIKNYKKYSCRQDKNNITITNNVATRNRKIRFTIYDKDNEITFSRNRTFCDKITNPYNMRNHFKRMVRFELNLNSVYQIKKMLKIDDNSIQSVLNSTATPIIDFLNTILSVNCSRKNTISTLRDYERSLLLKECNNDLNKVEKIVRKFTSPKVSIKQKMDPYKQLLSALTKTEYDNVLLELRELLSQN